MDSNQSVTVTIACPKPSRPKLVWVITIFYFLCVGFGSLGLVLFFGGFLTFEMNDTQRAYFESESNFDTSVRLFIGALNLYGAILLFRLKKHAFHIFLCAFVISILMTVYECICKNWIQAIGGPRFNGVLIGYIISIAVIKYTRSLTIKEILR
jgi:hypothetical protein